MLDGQMVRFEACDWRNTMEYIIYVGNGVSTRPCPLIGYIYIGIPCPDYHIIISM
jgi:hypothetical protein